MRAVRGMPQPSPEIGCTLSLFAYVLSTSLLSLIRGQTHSQRRVCIGTLPLPVTPGRFVLPATCGGVSLLVQEEAEQHHIQLSLILHSTYLWDTDQYPPPKK
ncbi:hypothetical protein E2C01_084572 [Portunus trituberculatus]|uniref:Uncharacterized protein n=1 Tax=Portunus trituberculatus TaxID=210409 RepID=A0A5B7J9N4_PORTR|nr:hypothetical protein [Portunus trituberculatus]